MKRLMIQWFAGLIFAGILPAIAQVEVGFSASLAKSDFNGEDTSGDIPFYGRRSIAVGGIVDFGINDDVIFRCNPTYLEQKSVLGMMDPSDEGVRREFSLSSLRVPLLICYQFPGERIRPYVELGPYLAYQWNSEARVSFEDLNVRADMDSVTEKFDIGGVVGAGVSVPFGRNKLFAEMRMECGFKDILDDGTLTIDGQEEFLQGDIKAVGTQIMVGMTFPLGGA